MTQGSSGETKLSESNPTDHPRKIKTAMKTTSLVSALGLGMAALVFSCPIARADALPSSTPVIQTLETPTLTAAQFNGMFKPIDNAPPLSLTFQFLGAPVSGTVNSQVFEGKVGTPAAGLFAYAYQIGVNNVSSQTGGPVHVDSMSFLYNATPTGTDFLNLGHNVYAYAVKDGAIGGLTPPVASPGDVVRVPNTLSWQPGSGAGVIRAQYVDPATQTQALNAGANSATFVIISQQPFTQQYVSLLSSLPTTGAFSPVYSATGGNISPVPVPEPTTILAWSGLVAGALFVRRVRKSKFAKVA